MPIAKVLLVEDNPADARLVKEALREMNPSEFEVQLCRTVSAAIEALGHSTPDVIVADLLLPDCTGTESIDRIRRCAPDVPLLALTGLNDEDVALECLKRGAQDYLVKANINAQALRRCLRYSLERQRVQLQEFSKALIDDLTGFQNRRGFLRLAEHHVKVAYRTHKPFLLSFIDLDGLKRINDSFGHQEGNRALVEAANVIRDSFRASDILGRIGGDEFVVLITDAAKDSIETVERRLSTKLEFANQAGKRSYDISFSVGTVHAEPNKEIDIDLLISRADTLMYKHKQAKLPAKNRPEPALVSARPKL